MLDKKAIQFSIERMDILNGYYVKISNVPFDINPCLLTIFWLGCLTSKITLVMIPHLLTIVGLGSLTSKITLAMVPCLLTILGLSSHTSNISLDMIPCLCSVYSRFLPFHLYKGNMDIKL
jgi:hypothetical protein